MDEIENECGRKARRRYFMKKKNGLAVVLSIAFMLTAAASPSAHAIVSIPSLMADMGDFFNSFCGFISGVFIGDTVQRDISPDGTTCDDHYHGGVRFGTYLYTSCY